MKRGQNRIGAYKNDIGQNFEEGVNLGDYCLFQSYKIELSKVDLHIITWNWFQPFNCTYYKLCFFGCYDANIYIGRDQIYIY